MSTKEEIKQEIEEKEAEIEGLKKKLEVVPDVRGDFEVARGKYCTYCRSRLYIVGEQDRRQGHPRQGRTYTCLDDECERVGVVVVMWTTEPPDQPPDPESSVLAP